MYAPSMLATLAQMMTLRPLSVDDLSAARYIHATAFAGAARNHYSPDDIDAFTAFIRSPRYADLLLGNHAIAACIGSEMVGTARLERGRAAEPDRAHSCGVRASDVHRRRHRPPARRLHRGRKPRAAGYQALEVSATLNAVGFFQDLGYLLVREGAWALPLGHEMPVAFMRKASFVGLQAAH